MITMLGKQAKRAAWAVVVAAGSMGAAHADSFQIDFNGNNYNYTFGAPVPAMLSASLVISTAGNAGSFEAVQSISGTINGEAITGLGTNAPMGWTETNLFTAVSPYLNTQGILFNTATTSWDISNSNGGGLAIHNMDKYWYVLTGTGSVTVTALASPTAPVPEPETYALFLAGLAMTGVVARRRKR